MLALSHALSITVRRMAQTTYPPRSNDMRADDFIAHLHELFDPLGRVATRAMFGGHGLYLDDTIVGIIDDGRLYLKTDAISEPLFAAAGCAAFVYPSKNGPMTMSYWTVPDEAMDSSDAMAPWARLAKEAAARKGAMKKPKSSAKRKEVKPKPKSLKIGADLQKPNAGKPIAKKPKTTTKRTTR